MADTLNANPENIDSISEMERPQKAIKVGDREILFQGLTQSQYMQLVHEVTLFRNDNTSMDRKLKGLDRLFRVLMSLLVNPEDRDYIEDQIADGEINVMFLVKALREIYDKQADTQKKVRRGSPAKRR